MVAYLKPFRSTIRNVFWSANNYALPKRSAKIGAKITSGTATTKRRIAGGISGSSSAIFLRRASMASPRWPMRNW